MLLSFLILALSRTVYGASYFFDGSTSTSGSGTEASPFNSLSAISKLSLAPGDKILLKYGSTNPGPLVVATSGTSTSRITVGAYGDSTLAKPKVVGGGLNAVLINGASYVTVENLDITNPGDNTLPLRGLYLYASDSGNVRGVNLQSLYIHDVRGWMPSTTDGGLPVGKYANASGGIVIEAAGTTTPTYFTDLLIQDNEIRGVDRQGIYTWTNWCRRTELASFWTSLCSQNWATSTGLLIQRNRLYDVGGDGIVVKGNTGALVQRNLLVGFNKRASSYNAGIWTANSVDGLFRYNTVSGGKTTLDGMAYDVDHSTSGTIFEYNVSHNNEGGFFLLCPYDKPTKNFTIRYNLSVNDRAQIFLVCSGALSQGKIYKNTIIIGAGLSPAIVSESTAQPLDVLFTDNIIRKEGTGTATWNLNDTYFSVVKNAFFGSINAYSNATSSITSAPGFAAPGLRDPKAYQLLAGYATLGSASPVSGDAAVDFFGNPTSSQNIGFYSGPATNQPTWISNFDDSILTAWTSTGTVASVNDPETGNIGKSVKISPSATFSRTIGAALPFRLNARVWIDATGSGAATTVRVASGSNAGLVTFDAASGFRSGEWQILEITLRSTGAVATLDGATIPVAVATSSAGIVTVSAGGPNVWLDDVFVTPL